MSHQRSSVKAYRPKPRTSFQKKPSQNAKLRAARMVANSSTRGMIGIESKFVDTWADIELAAPDDGAGGECDPAQPLAALNVMAEGDGPSSRDGRQIRVTNVFVNGLIYGGAPIAAPKWDQYVYVALVLDKQTNGLQLSSEDVFQNPSSLPNCAPFPLRNLAFTKRFRVLDHKRIFIPVELYFNGSAVNSLNGNVEFQLSHRFKVPLECNFSASGAEIANLVDNSIHVIAYCSDPAGNPKLQYNARVRFQG